MLKQFVRLLIFILCLFSCTDKEETPHIFQEPEMHYDKTCTWLEKESNFQEENYMSTFYTYYTKKIKARDYLSAATSLELVSLHKINYREFDEKFKHTITHFTKYYKAKLPLQKRNFIAFYWAECYVESGSYEKAMQFYSQLIQNTQSTDYFSCKDLAYAHMGFAYCNLCIGKTDLALKNNFKALTYFNQVGCISCKGSCYTTFMDIYSAVNDYPKAVESIDKASEYYRQANNTQNLVMCLYNKAIIYYDSGDYPKLDQTLDSAYRYFKNSGLKHDALKISIFTFYVERLMNQDKNAEAKQVLDELKPIVTRLNSNVSILEYETACANYFLEQHKPIQNVAIIEKSLPELKLNKRYEDLMTYASLLKDDAIIRKDFKRALHFEIEINEARTKLATEEIKAKTLELDKKYQIKDKEQKIIIQEKTIKNNRTFIVLLITAFIGLLLLVLIIFRGQKLKKLKKDKENSLMYAKNLIQKTEEERKRIAGDLHDSVNHELLNLKNSEDLTSAKAKSKIDHIINDIRIISRNLHPVMFDKIGLKSSVEQLLERAQINHNFIVTADIDYTKQISISDELQIYRIIQEALSNILKYSNAIAAKISIHQKQENLFIEIKDNGQGFNVNETLSTKDSFGLLNIFERTKSIGGEAKITSDNKGTIISIKI